MHFVSMAALFGGAVFRLGLGWPRETTALLRLTRIAAPLAALSGLGWAAATIAGIAGDATGLVDPVLLHAFFFETPFGPIVAARLVLLAATVVVAYAPMRDGARLAALAGVAGVLLVSQAWLGHAAAEGESAKGLLMLAAYGCHVLAAAAWVGGLPPLLFALRETRGGGPEVWRVLRRISSLATATLVVLVVAGIVNATFRFEAVSELATTTYGNVLSVKLGLSAAMLGLAAYNRCNVAVGRSLTRLRTSIAAELALGVLVLGAAAVLGITPPPH